MTKEENEARLSKLKAIVSALPESLEAISTTMLRAPLSM